MNGKIIDISKYKKSIDNYNLDVTQPTIFYVYFDIDLYENYPYTENSVKEFVIYPKGYRFKQCLFNILLLSFLTPLTYFIVPHFDIKFIRIYVK